MSGDGGRPPLAEVLAVLAREGLLEPGRVDAYLAASRAEPESPWYLRAMVGFGAWLAALLMIAFVAALGLAAGEGGFVALGLVFVVAAVLLRRRFANDFLRQLTLATSLAGQGLLAVGIVSSLQSDAGLELMLVTLIATNGVLVAVFPDDTHRFLSTLGIVACVTGLLYALEGQAFVPLVGPFAITAAIVVGENEARLIPAGWLTAASAVEAGLVIGACGCLLLSAVYVLPGLGAEPAFYPRPWISTVLLGAVLLRLGRDLPDRVFADRGTAVRAGVYAAMLVVTAAAWLAPGIVLALVIVVLGGVGGSVFYIGTGVAFLTVFMSAFFYGIEIGMLAKAATLVALGVAVLIGRWLLLRRTAGGDGGRTTVEVGGRTAGAGLAAGDPRDIAVTPTGGQRHPMRSAVLWAVLVAVLVFANVAIVDKERVLADGETILLPLLPRDPRSLLQGDYMTLRYALAPAIEQRLNISGSADGVAVVRVDGSGVAELVRVGDADVLAPDERRLRFRKRGAGLRIAGDAWFFEEGSGEEYADAAFGELKVDAAGDAVLIGLRNSSLERLGTAR